MCGVSLVCFCCFSLDAFYILSLCLVFVSLISMCLGMFLLGFILCGTLCLLDLIDYFFFHIGEIFNSNLFKNFLYTSFSLLFPEPLYFECWCVWYCPRRLWDCPQFFSFFLLYSAVQKLFPPFYLPAHCFILLLQIFCYWFLLEYF